MTDLSLIAEQEWNEARRRAVVIRPLLEFKHCPRKKACEAAAELGLSERQRSTDLSNGSVTASSLPYCRVVPTAGGGNSDWWHPAKICFVA